MVAVVTADIMVDITADIMTAGITITCITTIAITLMQQVEAVYVHQAAARLHPELRHVPVLPVAYVQAQEYVHPHRPQHQGRRMLDE
jgi:hypothetical protein